MKVTTVKGSSLRTFDCGIFYEGGYDRTTRHHRVTVPKLRFMAQTRNQNWSVAVVSSDRNHKSNLENEIIMFSIVSDRGSG